MKKIIHCFIFLIFFYNPILKTSQENNESQILDNGQKKTSEVLFANIQVTNSMYENNIEQIYGPTGLNIPSKDLENIKKAYCYLEFLTKLEKVKNDKKYQKHKSSFQDFLNQESANKPSIPTPDLINSNDWKSIPITSADLIKSAAWQLIIKSIIYDSLKKESDFIINATQANNQLFPYLPNIEMGYNSEDFTNLRLYQELQQQENLLHKNLRERCKAQCLDWKNVPEQNILPILTQFESTEFYAYTHNSDKISSIQKNSPAKNNGQLPITGLVQNQIICYFMFSHIQSSIQAIMSLTNLESVLTLKTSNLSPNFLFYDATDFIYLYDFFTLKNLREQQKTNPKKLNVPIISEEEYKSLKTIKDPNPSKNTNTTLQPSSQEDIEKQAADLIFGQLPIDSIFTNQIEKIYGQNGLDLNSEQLNKIKKCYCYLEFLTKIEKVKNDPRFQKYKIAFQDFLQPRSDKKPHMPTQALLATEIWKQISITQDDITQSSAWQNFIKSIICSLYDEQDDSIIDITLANDQIFPYIANIETAYETQDFTALRLYTQFTQLEFFMKRQQIQQYKQQCPDWKNLNSTQFKTALAAFKKTEFYSITHTKENSKNNQSETVPPSLREDITSFFILIATQDEIYKMINLNNLLPFLNQTNLAKISPNLCIYAAEDFIYLHDLFTLQNLIEENKKSPKSSQITMSQSTSIDQTSTNPITNNNSKSDEKDTVIIQRNLFSGVKKAFNKKNFSDPAKKFFKKDVKEAFNKENFADPAKKFFEKDIKKAFNKKNFADPTKKFFNKTVNNALKTGMQRMVSGVILFSNDLATGLIEASAGVTWLTLSIGKGLGAKTNPEHYQNRVRAKMNKKKTAISTALGSIVLVAAILVTAPFTLGATLVVGIGLTIGAGVADKRAQKHLSHYTTEPMSKAMHGMMLGMAKMTQGMSDGFIEMSVGLTFAGCSIGKALGAKVNPRLEANKVRARLERNMASINIAMSVIAVVIITAIAIALIVATGGTAAPQVIVLETTFNEMAIAGLAASGGTASFTMGSTASMAAVSAAVAADSIVVGAAAGGAAGAAGATAGNIAVTGGTISQASMTALTPTLFSQIMSATLLSGSFWFGQLINVGFSIFSMMAAKHQDDAAFKQAGEERDSIQSLWQFVEDSKIVATQEQNLFLSELHKKHKVAVENQTLGLQYYHNFLHGSVNNIQDQIAQALAQQYIQLLTPDDNGLLPADIGSSWGLQTPFLYLYPSQGFISTTLGRPDFPYAQEVAQAPLAFESRVKSSANLSDKQPQATKLWFNQKAIATLPQNKNAPLDVEIKFRILYTLNTPFHIGLYLGGNYHDYRSPAYLQSLKNQGTIDINDEHLAKMLVIKRDNAKSIPLLGVYEHDGKGWMLERPLSAKTINTASIYHMKANLNKNILTITFWAEDNISEKISTTLTVNPCDQRTFGVIFSGAAIEWNVVSPQLKIIENETARAQSNGLSEFEREQQAKAQRRNPQLYEQKNIADNPAEQESGDTFTKQIEEKTNATPLNTKPAHVAPSQSQQTISQLQEQAAGGATIEISGFDEEFAGNTSRTINFAQQSPASLSFATPQKTQAQQPTKVDNSTKINSVKNSPAPKSSAQPQHQETSSFDEDTSTPAAISPKNSSQSIEIDSMNDEGFTLAGNTGFSL